MLEVSRFGNSYQIDTGLRILNEVLHAMSWDRITIIVLLLTVSKYSNVYSNV